MIMSTFKAQCIHIFHSTAKEVFIVSGLKSTDVFVGEWATFSCQLSGKAHGKVQWWLDGSLLENSPFSEIGLAQGHIHTLTLKNLATDDSGTVTFKAGSLTSTAKLLVKGIMKMLTADWDKLFPRDWDKTVSFSLIQSLRILQCFNSTFKILMGQFSYFSIPYYFELNSRSRKLIYLCFLSNNWHLLQKNLPFLVKNMGLYTMKYNHISYIIIFFTAGFHPAIWHISAPSCMRSSSLHFINNKKLCFMQYALI